MTTELVGKTLLLDKTENRSTAFTSTQRKEYGLEGLLPPAVETLDLQVERCLRQLAIKPNNLEEYIYLSQLADENQTLFFKVLSTDPARFLPIVYDPTVAEACLKFGHIYRKPNGLYLSIDQRGRVKEVLKNWPIEDIRFICVSTGERILGLGDIGANGMGIPIGKLQLYTVCAGIPPAPLLPVLLDCGTNNEEYLKDPLYLGLRQKRGTVEELDSFVQEFVDAVQELYPKCCIHFEDWKGVDALRLLEKYCDTITCYNDDIQGTGSVTVAGLYNALKLTGGKLRDQRVLFLGAGSAGIGIADMIASAMALEGLAIEKAHEQISLFDVNGLLEPSRTDLISEQVRYAHAHVPSKSFVDVVRSLKPSIIIGVSTAAKAFNDDVVKAMSEINEKPIIFALSNPTEKAECTAEEAYKWSNGKAVYAGGVQFPPVHFNGQEFLPGQANNFYVFPAVALAVFATEATRVPDELFIEAARALANLVTSEQLTKGMVYPPQSNIFEVEIQTAIEVAAKVFDLGLARVPRPSDIAAWVRGILYKPEYPAA